MCNRLSSLWREAVDCFCTLFVMMNTIQLRQDINMKNGCITLCIIQEDVNQFDLSHTLRYQATIILWHIKRI